MTASIYSQSNENSYRIFEANGKPASVNAIIEQIGKSDVVFLGEQHDDAVAHALQFEIFTKANEKYASQRKLILSLEMFERGVQTVINEYLKNQITEAHFLSSSRPWGNYKTDYRPLVEYAKEKNIEVVAANAPRRYVNMVSRLGRDSLSELSPEAKKWLAPLPFGEASAAYAKKFNALMGAPANSPNPHTPMLAAQALWDATMAYSIAENLNRHKNALVIHLNGSFHTENRLGTVEHLLKYQPKTKILVVTMRYDENFTNFDKAKHSDLGDFVVLTDAKVPRSQK
ncbi:MAG TPA: ChaN family lipoprotein [Pyrinomonadaceae bacterium]|jgi:uncharacterized iron-regulated protein